MNVLRCVECPLKQWRGSHDVKMICEVEETALDLSNLLLVSPQILNTVKCQHNDLDAVIRECHERIELLNKTVERAINLKTERDDWPAHLEKPTEEDIKFLAELDSKD
jgi:hypothetical protein